MRLGSERPEFLLILDDYMVTKKNLESKVSENEIVSKAMKMSEMHPKTLWSLKLENELLQKTKHIILGSYAVRIKVVGAVLITCLKSVYPFRLEGNAN